VPLGILHNDETKTKDMVEILESYHQYLPSKPNGDPVILPLYCDGLSCERTEGAQEARLNGADRWTRLEGLEPCIQEWHRRQLQLQECYDMLFKQESQRYKGTLYHLKQYLNYSSVSSNMMKCFNSARELLDVITESYICMYATKLLNTGAITELPKDWQEDKATVTKKIREMSEQIVQFIYKNPNVW
jgi:hypothetical protein